MPRKRRMGIDPDMGRGRQEAGSSRQKRKHPLGIYRDAEDALAGMDWAEKFKDGHRGVICWEDPEEVRLYIVERRLKRRIQRLDNPISGVPSRICWRCKTFLPHPSEWVHISYLVERHDQEARRASRRSGPESPRTIAALHTLLWTCKTASYFREDKRRGQCAFVCRTCWTNQRVRITEGVPEVKIDIDKCGVAFSVTRYKIDGIYLAASRTALGLTGKEFAEKAGWSRSYQSRIENELQDVAEGTFLTIQQVLRECIQAALPKRR